VTLAGSGFGAGRAETIKLAAGLDTSSIALDEACAPPLCRAKVTAPTVASNFKVRFYGRPKKTFPATVHVL